MKAIVLKNFGGVENFQMEEIPKPSIHDHEVLIQTKAISINPVDIKTRSGKALADSLKKYNPIILGWDVSGTIVEIGKLVKEFKVGDDVFGMVHFVGHGKGYAEYVAAPAAQMALKPKNVSHEAAAAATLAALTAWQAFTKNGKLLAGQKVLIHAASGGVGHFAVQLAKHLGAYVIGTSSRSNKDFVLGLGADEHIDYSVQSFEEVISNVDFVLETIGGENFVRSLNVLKPTGTIVNLPSGLVEGQREKALAKGITSCYFMMVASSGEDMKMITHLLEKKIITSHVSKIYPFSQIAEAHKHIETGKTVGKIIVTL